MKRVSIVVPVYYNAGSLPLLYEKLQHVEESLRQRELEVELIFVDDGSGDSSYEELLKIKQSRPTTKIVKLSRNFGALQANKTGWQFVTGDCCVNLAADLQEPPELILQMVDRWLHGAKFVVCTRKKREDPFFTRLFAWVYYRLLYFCASKDCPPGGYSMSLMDSVMLRYMKTVGKNVNWNVYGPWLGFKPDCIDYVRLRRQHGKSRWTFSKKLKLFLDTMLTFSVVPLRVMTVFGLTAAGLSGLYGLLLLVQVLLGHREVPGFATLVLLMTFLVGVVIFMLGIISEYLWRIFDEVNKQPESVIEEVL